MHVRWNRLSIEKNGRCLLHPLHPISSRCLLLHPLHPMYLVHLLHTSCTSFILTVCPAPNYIYCGYQPRCSQSCYRMVGNAVSFPLAAALGEIPGWMGPWVRYRAGWALGEIPGWMGPG